MKANNAERRVIVGSAFGQQYRPYAEEVPEAPATRLETIWANRHYPMVAVLVLILGVTLVWDRVMFLTLLSLIGMVVLSPKLVRWMNK